MATLAANLEPTTTATATVTTSGRATTDRRDRSDSRPGPDGTVRLARLAPGQVGVIAFADLDAQDGALLRAMGVSEKATVKVCRVGEPCVVAVGGVRPDACRCGGTCRIGLSRRLAERIWIRLPA